MFINSPSGSGNSSSPCAGPASHPAAGKEENPHLRRLSPPGLTQRSKQVVCHRQISRRTRHGAMVSSPCCCAQTKGPLLAFSFLQSSVSKDVLNTANVSDMLFFPILYGISQLILLLLPSPSLCSTWISLRILLFLIY